MPKKAGRLAVGGIGGRMGRLIAQVALEEGWTIAAAIEAAGHEAIGRDAGTAAGLAALGVPVETTLTRDCDVLVDFSSPAGVLARVPECVKRRAAVVVGTTGLGDDAIAALRKAGRSIPVLWAANMSVGVNLLLGVVERLAAALGTGYDLEVVEMHHRHKKDAPSGTALALAKAAAAGRRQDFEKVVVYGREGVTGERPPGQIGLHAMRGGDVVGDHRVVFSAPGELIEVVHRAQSRETFARGAVRAAGFLRGKNPGVYTMSQVLGL